MPALLSWATMQALGRYPPVRHRFRKDSSHSQFHLICQLRDLIDRYRQIARRITFF